MNFWDKVTGNDITREFKNFEDRVKKLPKDYQEAWETIEAHVWNHSNFSGRNLIPVFENALFILEETSAEGQSAKQALGDDIKEFCVELIGEDSLNSFRDKLRKQLNNNVVKKLGK